MNAILLLKEIVDRRSIRRYQSRPVEAEKIDLLLEAARLAPSACNIQPVRVLVVDKPADLEFVRRSAYNTGATVTAPVILVGMTDTSADAGVGERIGELYEVQAVEPVDVGILYSAKNKPFQLKLGEEIAAMNAAIALEHIVLQAVNLGLGTCWAHHFEADEVREYFRIPAHFKLLTLIALGYPNEAPKARPRIKDVRYRIP